MRGWPAVFALLSAVQAPSMKTANANGEIVRTLELSVGTVRAVARTVPEVLSLHPSYRINATT